MSRSLLSAIRSVALSRGTSLVVTIVGYPLLVRALGPLLFGYYATILSVQAISIIIVSSGMTSGVRKYISEEGSTGRKSYIFSYYLRMVLLGATVFGIIFIGGSYSPMVVRLIGEEFTLYLKLLSVVLLFQVLSEYSLQALQGLQLEHKSEPLRVYQRTLFLALAIVVAQFGYGVVGVLVVDVIASSTTTFVALYYLSKEINISVVYNLEMGKEYDIALFGYGKWALVLSVLSTTIIHVDVLILSVLAPGASVGFYKAALKIVEMLWFIPRVLQGVLIQSVSNLWENGETGQILNITGKTVRYSFALTALLGVGFMTLGDDFLPLYYGPEYTAAVLSLVILVPGTIGYAIARPIISISMASGTVRPLIAATGFSAVLNLVLNLLLIPEFGIAGAAVATSIGYGSMVITHVYAAKQIGYSPFENVSLTKFVIAPVFTLVVILGVDALIADPIHSLVIVPPVGAVIFVIVAARTGLVEREEIRRTVNYVRRSIIPAS